jgi:AcrR family transcriptional regulator
MSATLRATAGRSGRRRDGEGGGRTGRRPGASGAREAILEASRAVFGELGYDAATIRLVAARAGVDPALIYHYFGSKQQLFVVAMELPEAWRTTVPVLAAGPREELGERMARFTLHLWDDAATKPLLLGLVRSAVSDPLAAEKVRQLLTDGPLVAISDALGLPDGRLRAQMAGSHVMGVAMLRHILRVEPVASAELETLVRILSPVLQHYLTGELDAG